MRISICTIPGRPEPTHMPPFGSMAIIQALRGEGFDTDFYNIDFHRPSNDDMKQYYSKNQFNLVGISAVVSTSYNLVKNLITIIEEVSPNTTIVVGGNMAASAEVLLRKAGADICVLGDGEVTIAMLASQIKNDPKDIDALKAIKGLGIIDQFNEFVFTGYQDRIPGKDISWPDFRILEEDNSLSYYLQFEPEWYSNKGMIPPKEWAGMRDAVVVTTKGCVARCTFCHRFEKGYRMRPFEQVVDHIKFLKKNYGVGFIQIFDENFGSNVKLTNQIVTELGKMNIKWRAGGVRARTVTLEQLQHWKKNGCDYIGYGIESGSQTMLDVMEKNTTVEQNINAIKWTYQAGISTNIQLVLAMPGENDATINETISFLKECTPYLSDNYRNLGVYDTSMTYAQALPGTPLYEYYRENGYIGPSLQDEEDYLLYVSDTNASDISHYVNATKQPMLKVLSWRRRIYSKINQYYFDKIHNVNFSFISIFINTIVGFIRFLASSVYPKTDFLTPLEKQILKKMNIDEPDSRLMDNLSPYRLLYYNNVTYKIMMPLYYIYIAIKKGRRRKFGAMIYFIELITYSAKNVLKFNKLDVPKKSLRKIVDKTKVIGDSSPNMNIIREGR